MAKPDPWRFDPSSYPVSMVVPVRYQDLDPLGHVNNVAMSAIFETARVHFHHLFGRHPVDLGMRWLVAAVTLNYLEEAHFPHDIVVHSGIGRVGNSSWTLLSTAVQQGHCVATCDTVMVSKGPSGVPALDSDVRAIMAQYSACPADRS